jgi:hypothetical protein
MEMRFIRNRSLAVGPQSLALCFGSSPTTRDERPTTLFAYCITRQAA